MRHDEFFGEICVHVSEYIPNFPVEQPDWHDLAVRQAHCQNCDIVRVPPLPLSY